MVETGGECTSTAAAEKKHLGVRCLKVRLYVRYVDPKGPAS
jgi:hypothetical protein